MQLLMQSLIWSCGRSHWCSCWHVFGLINPWLPQCLIFLWGMSVCVLKIKILPNTFCGSWVGGWTFVNFTAARPIFCIYYVTVTVAAAVSVAVTTQLQSLWLCHSAWIFCGGCMSGPPVIVWPLSTWLPQRLLFFNCWEQSFDCQKLSHSKNIKNLRQILTQSLTPPLMAHKSKL